MLPDDVRLPIAVYDDKGDMSGCRQHIKGFEAQDSLFNPAILIVGQSRLTGWHADKRYRRNVGEYAYWHTCKVLEHYFTLQLFGWNVAEELDAWQRLASNHF